MVNIVTNDKVPSPATEHKPSPEGSTAHLRNGEEQHQTLPQNAPDDSLNLSEIGRILSQAVPTGSSRRVDTTEQATALALRIREQFEQSGSQALAAQTGGETGSLATLLESPPA